ncbi:MAG: bifunctional DNA primase/polymerase, partial [Gammaproteobacteria bacterium]|nr:bifunctional DNA primase/polymerase [Gammaproteobacteria bacterium]
MITHPVRPPKFGDKKSGKAPIPNEWTSPTSPMTEAEIRAAWEGNPNLNMGMLTGDRSGVTVIDIDKPIFLSNLLQGIDTSAWIMDKREGSDRGHIYFKHITDVPACKKHTCGIEVLNNGNNVIIPPSMHFTGTQYQWNIDHIPTLDEIPEIPDLFKIRLLALFERNDKYDTVVKKCRPCVKKYLNNPDALHGANGRMQMLQISTELMANGADSDTVDFFAHLLYGTEYDAARTQQEISGIDASKPPKCETLKREYPDIVDCENCKHSETEIVIDDSTTIEAMRDRQQQMKLRMNIVLAEGHYITKYIEYMKSQSDAYFEYNVCAALWLLSSVTQGKVSMPLKQHDIAPNLYFMLLGMSTLARKTTAVNKAKNIYEAATELTLFNNDFSVEGYCEMLAEQPIQAMIRDEAGGFLAKAHKNHNDGLFDMDCQIYDGQNHKKTLAAGKNKEKREVVVTAPYVTHLYATTRESYIKNMTIADYDCGYGWRCLYALPEYNKPRMPLAMNTDVDRKLRLDVLEHTMELYDGFRKAEYFHFTAEDGALELHDKYTQEMENYADRLEDEQYGSATGRAADHILKIAMLYEI